VGEIASEEDRVAAVEGVLGRGSRCLLAFPGRRGPLLAPMAYWYDGDALWMTTAADTAKARVLARDGACAVYVGDAGGGVKATGHARVLSARDPLGLLLRAPVITGAIAGLALHDPATLLGYARDAVRVPQRWAPHNRVVLRVELSAIVGTPRAVAPPGVAPALPAAVPADVRRALAGVRRVAVARSVAAGGSVFEVEPGWWDGGYALSSAVTGRPVEADGPVSVALDSDAHASPLGVRGLVLHGRIADGVLRAERATFWRGFDIGTVDVEAAGSGVVLPD
jgi:hypothetical protein